ncbi:lycopene cyclase domain-containing protein [Mucilaginibacter arboris]|uniref:Lycopene cyclase domain-containing protein n=1 Tax=Mucilaginibacter arboris TaxID=2682090 RepID=A0A7K1T1C8_9SPHI|nr:lycopene cyclase domain-containing protein [Mucilaginibacter arboris]MVN23321.1 lycopene cyclase domain-containing protein [Mucilaginibacter arboris]
MKYAYLLIDFLSVIFPLLLSFDKRVAYHKSWKFIWPGLFITGILFLAWDVFFTVKGVWSFNPNYILGITFFRLPLEEILFFLTIPFSCIFIYECLNYYVKWKIPDWIIKLFTALLLITSAAILLFFYKRLYTLINFGTLFLLLILLQFIFKVKWLNRFFLAYLVSLIPFYIVNGILTSIPIVSYNNAENLAVRVGTIPVEDHFYLMSLLLMNVAFFEYYRKRDASFTT